jgi:PAS domain-containing protein
MPPGSTTELEMAGSTDRETFPDRYPHSGEVPRAGPMARKPFARSTSLKNLVLLSCGSLAAFVAAVLSGLFRGIEQWEQRSNLSAYHVSEFAILIAVIALAALIFLIHRSREKLFHRVETAKKEWEHSLDSIRDMVILSDLDGTIHRCNRAFKDFVGLPYGEILRKDFPSLLKTFGIEMDGLDLRVLDARFHISGRWFGVRSYPYEDSETADITRVVILMQDVTVRNVSKEKVRFLWGHAGNPGNSRNDDSRAIR